MCTEAVRVGQMIYTLKRQRCTIYEFKTDSILYRPPKRMKKDLLETLTFKDNLRDIFEPAGQIRLDQYCSMALPNSDELVFRVAEAVERDLLKMNPGRPARRAEYTHHRPSMRDVDEEEARALVINGGNLLVEGIAGVGKTHFLQSLVQDLRALGKSVAILSKTHVASQRAGGCTADHWVRRHVLHGSPRLL
jgi:hypothetical protein